MDISIEGGKLSRIFFSLVTNKIVQNTIKKALIELVVYFDQHWGAGPNQWKILQARISVKFNKFYGNFKEKRKNNLFFRKLPNTG